MPLIRLLVLAAAALTGLVAVAVVAGTSGCTYRGQQEEVADGPVPFFPGERKGDVTIYRDLQFNDIPIPAEFQLLRDKSYSFQGSNFRSGVFYYEGFIYWRDALRFFENEMPKEQWELQSRERNSFFVELRFRKGPEQLIVVVRNNGRNTTRAELQLDNIDKNDLLLRGRLRPEDSQITNRQLR